MRFTKKRAYIHNNSGFLIYTADQFWYLNECEELITQTSSSLNHRLQTMSVCDTFCPDPGCIVLKAQGFHGEIEDMQQWLKDTERQLLASKAVGGLPDTAREQLNAHLVCV